MRANTAGWGSAETPGALADRTGERPLAIIGLLLQAAGTAWIALIAAPGLAYPVLIAPMSLLGVGFAAAFAATGSYSSPAAFSDGFSAAFGIAAGVALAGAIAGILLPARKSRQASPTDPVPANPSATSQSTTGHYK